MCRISFPDVGDAVGGFNIGVSAAAGGKISSLIGVSAGCKIFVIIKLRVGVLIVLRKIGFSVFVGGIIGRGRCVAV